MVNDTYSCKSIYIFTDGITIIKVNKELSEIFPLYLKFYFFNYTNSAFVNLFLNTPFHFPYVNAFILSHSYI